MYPEATPKPDFYYGFGGHNLDIPRPRKILYEEDKTRAKYYKAFMPKDDKKPKATVANSEVINLMDENMRTLSQVFIEKHEKLRAERQIDEERLFVATIEALEVDGIYLTGRPLKSIDELENEYPEYQAKRPPMKLQNVDSLSNLSLIHI